MASQFGLALTKKKLSGEIRNSPVCFLDCDVTVIYIPIMKFPTGKGSSDNDGSFVSQVNSSNCLSGIYFKKKCQKKPLMKKLCFKLLTFSAKIYCDQMPESDETQKSHYSKIHRHLLVA